ncbi:hypothetical protein L9F63_027420, partial [Diploptera punctata]
VNVTEIAANLVLRWETNIPVRHRKNVREWLRNMKYLAVVYLLVVPAVAYACLHSGFSDIFIIIVILSTLQS